MTRLQSNEEGQLQLKLEIKQLLNLNNFSTTLMTRLLEQILLQT